MNLKATKKWWKEAVIYQIYPRSFMDNNGDGIGDLKGIIEKLDYIKYLGVDAIWLSPIYKSPNYDNGYDISDYRDIMDDFGTIRDFDNLLDEVHKRGLKLLMDLVVNHTSSEHKWFEEARKSKNSPYRDYYFFREGKGALKPPNNWKSWFGGSAWEYDNLTEEYYLHLYHKHQPDLNWDNKKVRREIYDIMKFWLDKGVDGFRIDIVNYISKVKGLPNSKNIYDEHAGKEFYLNGPNVHKYLKEMRKEVLSRYHDIVAVGEVECVNPNEARKYVDYDRNELDMLLSWEHMYVDYGKNGTWDIKNWSLADLKEVLKEWQIGLSKKGWNTQYLSSHDQPRQVSRFANDERYRVESAKMLATMIHTLKGTPFVYQGEEIGMTNVVFNKIDECNDILSVSMYNKKIRKRKNKSYLMEMINYRGRDNARTPMQWNNNKNAGFTEGTPWLKINQNYKFINVEESIKNKDSIFHYYKNLIELRRENNIFIYGNYEVVLKDDEYIYSYLRNLDNEKLLVILNFSGSKRFFKLPDDIKFEYKELLISNYDVIDSEVNAVLLKPYEVRVYKLKLNK